MPSAPRSHSSAARGVYIGILASTIIVTLGAFVVSRSLGSSTSVIGPVDLLALASGLGALVAGFRRVRRLGERGVEPGAEQWWEKNAGRALLAWGLLELGALIGALLLFATGHLPVYAVLTGLALAGLALSAPGRLAPR